MTTPRRFLSSLLSAPGDGLMRGLRWLFPGLDAAASNVALRRSEQVVDDLRVELGKVIASRHLANKRLTELELRHGALRREIEAALDRGHDALARERVSEELQTEAQIDGCRRTMDEASSLAHELEHALAALLRARREFVESATDHDIRGEKPATDALRGDEGLTHERRVQERLLDIKSRRQPHGVEASGSTREQDKD